MLRRTHLFLLALPVLGALVLSPAATAAPGQLDPSFGSGGSVRLLPSNEDIFLGGVATQPDGRIVLAGGDFVTKTTVVVRLLENGALDPSFGGDGIVNLTLGTDSSSAQAVSVQPDGRILIAGSAKGAVDFDFMFARLNADGTPDLTFGGGDGSEIVPVGTEQDRAEALALGPGGRIVASGEARLPASEVGAAVAVLGANGLPDPAYFGGDGVTIETTAPKSDQGVAVAMLGDGRVLLADANGAGGGDGFTLIQLLAAGTRDPAFGGGDGLVEAPIPSAGTETSIGGRISDFKLLADGRIVASGYGYDQVGSPPESDAKAVVARFLADGQLDAGFGSAGWFSHQFGPGSEDADDVEVTPAGKLVIAGPYDFAVAASGNPGRAVARLEPNGTLDPSFGAGGVALSGETAPFGETFEDAALDPEERLVFSARAYIGNGNTEVVVSRYLGDRVPKQAGPPNQAPRARMKKVPLKIKAQRLKNFLGTATDPDGDAIAKVQIALTKAVPRGAKASARKGAPKCLRMKNAKAKFKPAKPQGPKGKKRCQPRWLGVKGTDKWSFELKRQLAPGRYVVYARAIDAAGLAESAFSRKAGNRFAFRVLPAD